MLGEDEMSTRRRGFFGWILALVVAVFILAAVGAFVGHLFYGPGPMYYYGPGYFPFGFFPFGFIFFVLFIFLIARMVFWRGGWGWGRWGYRGYYGGYWGDAREILKHRYAKGELTKEQFEQMMRDLEQHQ